MNRSLFFSALAQGIAAQAQFVHRVEIKADEATVEHRGFEVPYAIWPMACKPPTICRNLFVE